MNKRDRLRLAASCALPQLGLPANRSKTVSQLARIYWRLGIKRAQLAKNSAPEPVFKLGALFVLACCFESAIANSRGWRSPK
jgi:hypothetical protein